jgi:uncharacterized protein
MMAEVRDASNPLAGLKDVQVAGGGLLPVHQWDPPFCGNIDMRIAVDGTWYYMNSPIGRKPLYKLFSRILRRDGDDYFLVTPVEKCGIRVVDAPFVAVRMSVSGQGRDQLISFETNVDDVIVVNAEHPLRFADEDKTLGLKPYVLVRANLEALVVRSLFYDLVDLGVSHGDWFGVWSAGLFFPMKLAVEVGV